jgi:hypothetical protein
MLYGIWPGGVGKSWKWAADVGGHYWRTAADIMNAWESSAKLASSGSVLHNFDMAYSIPDISTQTAPGRFTFLDQMVVGVAANGKGDDHHKGGVPGPGLNLVEAQAHMSMWVMAASPLLTCNDVRNMTAEIKEILTNPEVLAVHKDPAARMATRIDVGGGLEEAHSSNPCASNWSIYGKVLSDGSSAVMVLNRGTTNATVNLAWEDVGDSMATAYAVRDLWQHVNLTVPVAPQRTGRAVGRAAGRAPALARGIELNVPPHGVRMLRLWPEAPPPPPTCPTGFTPHPAGYWFNTDPCPNNVWSNCTADNTNTTVAACTAKCVSVDGCVAFELYVIGVPVEERSCYIFLHSLEPPFTASAQSLTCVRGTL